MKYLKGEKLRERVAQRKVFLYTLLDNPTLSDESPEIIERILSPFAQMQFLQEHCKRDEILAILISIDPEHPFLDKYIEPIFDEDDPHLEIAGMFLDTYERVCTPTQQVNILMWAIGQIAEQNEKKSKVISLATKQKLNTWWHENQYKISWAFHLVADALQHTRKKDKYKQAGDVYLSSYETLLESWCALWMVPIELLMYAARAYWVHGDLESAMNLYNSVIVQCETDLEVHTSLANDLLYTERKKHQLTTLAEQKEDTSLSATLFYTQVLLEKIHQGKQENENMHLQWIRYGLDDFYTILKEKQRIAHWVPSPYPLANLRRLVYGQYMYCINEQESADQELRLIPKTDHITYKAAQILMKEWSVTYIDKK